MVQMLITESERRQLKSGYITENTYNKVEKIWESITITERIFVVEFLSVIYPEKIKILNESKWYNTVADIIGIFDPTGVVDIMNGISYWRQGDKLFAMLSWIGAIPGLGDLIAKPIIGALKMGSPATKAFKAAVESGNAAKIAETAAKAGSATSNFVKQSVTWGDRIVNVLQKTIGRIPIGLPLLAGGSRLSGKGFVRVVQEWVDLFKSASPKMFKTYKGAGQTFSEKYLTGGVSTLFGNRATRSLSRRTKAYLGFLDYLGLGNWKGEPEDLVNKLGKDNVDAKYEEYKQSEAYEKNTRDDESSSMRPPGFTDAEWDKVKGSFETTAPTGGFNIASVMGNSANPITALFKFVLS